MDNKKTGINNKPSHLLHLRQRKLTKSPPLNVEIMILCHHLSDLRAGFLRFFPYLFHSLLFLKYFKKGGLLDACLWVYTWQDYS